jgi:signal transduction histidine kinase
VASALPYVVWWYGVLTSSPPYYPSGDITTAFSSHTLALSSILSSLAHPFIPFLCCPLSHASLLIIPLLPSLSSNSTQSMLAVDISETNSRLSLALADQKIFEGEVALNSKRSVVRHVTHEVRTPLNTVAIGADVLTHEVKQLGDLIPPVMMELVVGIKEASAAALEIVNELLAFEKISAGLFTIEPVTTSLFPFLKHCMQQHFIPALAKEIKLILGPSMYSEIMVSIDPTKMGIVMRNIISNSIKFSKVGGYVNVAVEVKGFEEGGMVVISVKDSGAGLSAENVTRLFQEGVQFNANALQNGDGSGFGLYISKAIMELHEDGDIWAESEGEGLGSTFFMQLTPLALDLTQHETCVVSESEIIVEECDTVPLRILVVDDSQATRKMMVRMLHHDKHECVQAEQGLAAVSEITRSMMRRNSILSEDSVHNEINRDRDKLEGGSPSRQSGPSSAGSGWNLGPAEDDRDRQMASFDMVLMDSR